MKKVLAMAVGLLALTLTTTSNAQVTQVGGGSGVANSTPYVVTNIIALTDHAELVGLVFKDVNGVLVNFSAAASANSNQPYYFYPYTNSVKTLEGIMAIVTNSYVSLPVVSTNGQISVSVQFYNSSDGDLVLGYTAPPVGQSSPSMLFEGYNSGTPQMSQYGQWVLPDYAEQVQMRLSGNIFVYDTNVVSAHLVYTNSAGQWMSMDLPVNYLQGFTFPPDWAGQGILVLGTYRFVGNNVYYDQHAYDLSNGAKEVPITYVLVRALLEGSDDFSSFADTTNLVVQLYTYQDGTGMTFGKVPLLMTTFSKTMLFDLGVFDQLGNYATSFIIEDEATNVRTTVNVPSGNQSVNVMLPKGVYHIIPKGMNIQPSWKYSYYYGEKG